MDQTARNTHSLLAAAPRYIAYTVYERRAKDAKVSRQSVGLGDKGSLSLSTGSIVRTQEGGAREDVELRVWFEKEKGDEDDDRSTLV